MASTDEQEINYALVAQQIEGLTLSTQEQILTATKTYRNLFEGSVSQFPPTLAATINAVRKIYHKRDWQGFLANHQEALFKSNAKVISCTSDEYPPLLKQISRAPRLLYVRGSVTNLHLPQIAIVGSRQMTRSGQQNALTWSRFFADSGFTITSGLALGVDGIAHEGALQASAGSTIAVMATGIDKVYPKRHQKLGDRIVDAGGTLVTEFSPGINPLARHFPQRNRIISGLSLGVLVVEAAIKSGSLITARTALEQNREVFAIPGSIHSPQSKGCHLLIKQGAHLVETADEVIAELGGALGRYDEAIVKQQMKDPKLGLDKIQTELLEILSFDPVPLDTLVEVSKWPIGKLAPVLVSLELSGCIANDNGFYQRLI